MNRMSHSFHISSGKHSISTSTKLSSVDKHNNRKFTNSNNDNLDLDYSKLNTTLIGSDNISNDVRELYTELFDRSVKEFNERQNRTKNIITSYFDKISNDTKQHIAEEIIVQFGSTNDDDLILETNSLEAVENIKGAYSDYLSELQKQVPNFKIANATIHFDETNPHMHIIGVPISENNTKGLSTKVSKRSVFNRETLSKLQTDMGQVMAKAVKDNIGLDVYHDKGEGRKKQLTTPEIVELKELKNKLKADINKYNGMYQEVFSKFTNLDTEYLERKEAMEEELKEVKQVKNNLLGDVTELTEEKELLTDIIANYSEDKEELKEEVDHLKSERQFYAEDTAKLKQANQELSNIYNNNLNLTIKQTEEQLKKLKVEKRQRQRQRDGGLSL